MRLLSLVFSLLPCAAIAQNINSFGLFPTIDHSGDLSNKFSYNVYLFDAITLGDDANGAIPTGSFYLYGELGLSYKLTTRWSVTASYVHERQNPFRDDYRVENRAFQQITYKHPFPRLEWKHRLRFDERFIQDRTTGSASFSGRLRYLMGVKWPSDARAYFMGYVEPFFNTSQDFTYEENWSAAQLGYKLNDRHGIEAGLLLVNWKMSNGWFNQWYMQLTWVNHLDFRSNAPEQGTNE
ncbi:MAG: DUF2490 domain-containing protein [Flavobacteriales bacterium]|nr:MAG: DUF2490 domain-containing protein [Flavobacteriales bacterium]